MTDVSLQQDVSTASFSSEALRRLVRIIPAAVAVAILLALAITFYNLNLDSTLLTDSTVGELAVWMAGQSEEEAPESLLGQYAKNWALQTANPEKLDEAVLLASMRGLLVVWCALAGVLGAAGVVGFILNVLWSRTALLLSLLGVNGLLFIIPTLEGDYILALVLIAITLLALTLLFASQHVTRVIGFFVALSGLLVAWETVKGFAAANAYDITLPVGGWSYQTYDSLESALAALQSGENGAVMADRKDLADLVPAANAADAAALPYSDLHLITNLNGEERIGFLPVKPNFPGRLAIAVRNDEAGSRTNIGQFTSEIIGAVAGEFAEMEYLSVPRELMLLDLKIFNDLNLPHLQNIAEALFQPARRNGPLLLIRILAAAGLYTWGEALFGFVFGASLGFLLGTLFAHSPLMERGLLPYVVASQTVPILAIAPMVVIWLGAGPLAVSVIAAYLTFFPVTINTMRGLQSPPPTAVELMHSYAASRWAIMWKLRFPAALPYIFTALKVSATASVVGAIIGELPSSIRDGLGRAILDFSSDYSLISTPKLWAAIIMAAAVGIVFFVIVSVIERVVLRGYVRES